MSRCEILLATATKFKSNRDLSQLNGHNHRGAMILSMYRYTLLVCATFFFFFSIASAAKLDIEGRDLNGQDIKNYGGLVTRGVLVTKPTGNALSAGIQEGDVIFAIAGQKIRGIFEMEEVLRSLRGKSFQVQIHRIYRKGLLKMETFTFDIKSPIDLQIRKAYTLNLGDDSEVKVGQYRGQTLLMWHANRVWVYDKKSEKENFVSLIKVYSVPEHKTYRYTTPASIKESRFLTNNGLLLYVSSSKAGGSIGVIDIETSERSINWKFEIKKLKDKPYDLKIKDINGDDIPEIFFSVDGNITCIDGATGNVIWFRGQDDMRTFFGHERVIGDDDYPVVLVDDFTRDGAYEITVGPLLLNAATGEKKSYLSFDPVKFQGGIMECRQLIGDPIPDIISKGGLYDGNSGQNIWQPLRSKEYFMADLTGNGRREMVYLLKDKKLHVHDMENHRELYSIPVEGVRDLALDDFNRDGYADIIMRKDRVAYLYQTNIPVGQMKGAKNRGIGYAASLLDFGLRKDKFYVFGKELFDQGEYVKSIPLFLRAMVDNPEREDTIRYLASAYIKTKNIAGALTLLREKKKVYAREVLQEFSGEIVAYLLDRNDTWQAIRFLEMKKDADPLLLSRCYLAVGKPEVAIKLMTEMQEKPTEAQLLLGKSYVLLNKMVSARIAFKNYLKYYPTSSEGWFELGQLEAHEGNWNEAEEALTICKDLNPILGHISLSEFYLKKSPKQNVEESLRLARKAYNTEPSNRTRIQLANALNENENYKEASLILASVEDPGPQFNRYEKLLQRAHYQVRSMSMYEEAEKLLLSVVFKKKNFKAATTLLEEIIARYSKSTVVPLAHYRLGEVYLDSEFRDEDKAMFHFKEVVKTGHALASEARSQLRKLDQGEGAPKEQPVGQKLEVEALPKSNTGKPLELDGPAPTPRTPGENLKAPEKENKGKEEVAPKKKLIPKLKGSSLRERRRAADKEDEVNSTVVPSLKIGD